MPPRVVLKTVRVVFSSMTYKESSAPTSLSNFPISLVFPCHFFVQFVICYSANIHPHLGQSIHHLLGDKMPPRVVLKTVRVVFSSMTYKESSAPMPLSNFPISLVFPCHFFIQFVIFVYALHFTVEQTHSAWTLDFKRKKKTRGGILSPRTRPTSSFGAEHSPLAGKIKCLVCGFVSNTIRVVFSSIKYNKSNQFTMRPLQREECAIEPMGRKYIFLSGSGWLLVWLGVSTCCTGKV